MFHYSHIQKIAQRHFSYACQWTAITFNHNRDVIRTHVLRKFHKDWTNHAISKLFTMFVCSYEDILSAMFINGPDSF